MKQLIIILLFIPLISFSQVIVDKKLGECKYYKIQNVEGTDFVTYSCSESSYKGKIGFAIADGSGIVLHFSNE